MAQDCTAADTVLQAQASLNQRKLFDLARSGEVRAFKSLLRKSRTTVGDINFQYSAKIAEGAGCNLWPWYWCIDTRDGITLCWGAPSGIEPEAGDTLLIITLKEHAKSILETRTLNLGIRNSSGRDAAGIAASYGRESLIPLLRAREEQQQEPKASTIKRRERREQRRMRLGTDRATKARHIPQNAIIPNVPSSCIGGYPRVDRPSTRNNAKVGVLDQVLSDSLDYQRDFVGTGGFQIAPKGAFGAAVIGAGALLRKQNSYHENADDPGTPLVGQANGERKISVSVDRASSHLSKLCNVHPSPDETRAVAVQTDPERFCSRDATAPTTVKAAQRTTGCQTAGVLSPVPLVSSTDNARLQRRSTAPGDMLSHSLGARHSTPSTGPGEPGGSKPSNTWKSVNSTDPDTRTPLQREGMEQGRPISGTTDANLGRTSGSAFSAEFHHKDHEKSSIATIAKHQSLPCENGDDTENPAAPEKEDLASRQQNTQCHRDGGSTGSGDDCSPPGAVDSLLARRSTVDAVTRQLQEILREDALQDDGTLDYGAAFELFDVDHDGNATPDELHSVFERLGVRNLLDDEGVAMIVDRVPRNASGLITQNELQQFADRPAGFCWALHRGSNDHVAGCEDVQGVESGSGFSVVLHELKVNDAPRAGGVFSWKKAPNLASLSLFVRITRGLHVVESVPVLSSSLPLDGDSGGNNISDAKCATAAWSWRWEETLVVPRIEVAGTKGEKERKAGGGGETRERYLADPPVVAVHKNEELQAVKRETFDKDILDIPSRQAVSMSVVVSGDDAADNLQGDGVLSSCEVDTLVRPNRVDSTDSSESRRSIVTKIGDQLSGGGPVVAKAGPHKADDGAKKKQGVYFWSPRRGRRNTEAAARGKQNTGVCTGNYDSRGAVTMTPDAAVVAEDDLSGSSRSSSYSETSESDKQEHTRMNVRSASVEVNDATVVAEGAVVGEGAHTEANDGVTIKRAVSFWGPRKGRKTHTSDTAIDEQSSQVVSKCDSEASIVFDISDPEESGDGTAADEDRMESLVPVGESSIVNIPQYSLHKKMGGSFWSPRRKGNGAAKTAEIDSHARSDSGATATTGLRLPPEVTKKSSNSREQRGRQRRPEQLKASTTSDVVLLEVWEVKGATELSPCPTKEAVVPVTGCSDCKERVESPRARDFEHANSYSSLPLDGTEAASNCFGSGEEPLLAQTSEHAQPLSAMVETTGDPPPANADNLETPAARSRGAGITVLAKEQGCLDDDRIPVGGCGVSAAADEASVADIASTRNARRKRQILSPLGRRIKGEGPSKLPSSAPLVASSETENTRGSLSTDNRNDAEESARQEAEHLCERGETEISDPVLDSRVSNVPERGSTDDEGDAGDESTAKQAQQRRKTTFLSSYDRRKTTNDSPRSAAAKPKPILWGRLTIRVAEVLLAGRHRSADDDDSVINGRKLPSYDTVAMKTVPSPDGVPVRSPTVKTGEGSSSSVFGMRLARRGPKQHANGKVETLGSVSACDQLDETASDLLPQTIGTSAVEGWFEIEHPKGKKGKRAKGRVHLTLTCLEPTASSENGPQACVRT